MNESQMRYEVRAIMKLKGKVAVVTGGASGLGYGICRCLAREGADIVRAHDVPETVRALKVSSGILSRLPRSRR